VRRPIVFLGPSLSAADAGAVLDADYRPPVKRGDVLRAAEEEPPLIGIIDGVFLATLPPSPMEVLRALQTGVPILGAASLGALRAVELEPFGMIGVGRIFHMYRRRQLTADDEVALVFAPDDFRPQSEPLVNMRFALGAARRAGVITEGQRRLLLRLARATYFPERSWPRLWNDAAPLLPQDLLDRVRRFVSAADFNLKRADALRLLATARRMLDRARDR
jgi:hypothetical protein